MSYTLQSPPPREEQPFISYPQHGYQYSETPKQSGSFRPPSIHHNHTHLPLTSPILQNEAIESPAALPNRPQPPPTPAPYHSYPHLVFRLPDSFADSWTSSAESTQVNSNDTTHPSVALASSSSSSSSPNPALSIHPSPVPNLASKLRSGVRYHVSFRAMHRSDIAQVAALHDILFPVRYDLRFYNDLLLADRVTILAFLECNELSTPGPDGLSPVNEPLLIGLATGKFRELHGQCRRHYSGYVVTLGVDSRFRRLGLGRFLLKHLICMIREGENRCQTIFLHVLASNTSAIKLYESCGFKVYEHLPGHYHIDGAEFDAIKLVKYINLKAPIYDDLEEGDPPRWCNIM